MKHLKSFYLFESRSLVDSTDPYSIVEVSPKTMPEELTNTCDSAVAYWEQTKKDLGLEPSDKLEISPNEVIYSTQGKVDMSIVDNMSDEQYSEGDIVIADYEGKKWIFDGHHRMIRDRKAGRPSMVYILDEDNVDFINRIIYGEGDEDY